MNLKTYGKMVLVSTILICNSFTAKAQVGVGTANPDPSSILEVKSTQKGMLVPRMTATQKNTIASPATGLLIYQTDGVSGFWYYNGTAWQQLAGSGWKLTGNSGTTAASNFVGTTDAQALSVVTNNTERIHVDATGNVGIGTSSPTQKLHLNGPSLQVLQIKDGTQGADRVLTSNANGVAFWESKNPVSSGPDNDWFFDNNGSYPNHVYHQGRVTIGKAGDDPTLHLDVDNGLPTGSTYGLGDVEVITDGNNETIFSHRIIPFTDNQDPFGMIGTVGGTSITARWNRIYAVNGTIQTSDATLKNNIKPINYGLNELLKLKPVSYYWKSEYANGLAIPETEKQLKLGLIAQDVQKIIPEVVYDSMWVRQPEPDSEVFKKENLKYMGINYEELIPVMVKAKQEQHQKLEMLKLRTAALEARLEQLLKKQP